MDTELAPYWIDAWARNYTILIDTCSAMQSSFQNVVETLSASLKKYRKKLIVPECAIKELKKIAKEASERGTLSERALDLIACYREEKLIEIRTGIPNGYRPDEYFLSYAPNRVFEKIMFITQDTLLARDLLAFNGSGSCLGNFIKVKRITDEGTLKNFDISHDVKKQVPKPKATNAGDILKQLGF